MDLYCCESARDFECRAYADPALVRDGRILTNLLAAEDRYMITGSYFDCFQTELKPYMRKVVTQWMLEVCEEQGCQPDVYWLAVNYMDRFLGLQRMNKSNVQLLGAVCLFVASKLKESLPLTAEKLVLYTAQSITLDELWQWELLVLGRLKWDLCAVTPHDFVDYILSQIGVADARLVVDVNDKDDATRQLTHAFISLCALEYKFMTVPPSMLACACVTAALRQSARRIGASAVDLTSDVLGQLQQMTQIESDYIRNTLEQVEEFISAHLLESQQASAAAASACSAPEAASADKRGVALAAAAAESEKAGTPTDIRDIHF